MKKRISFYKMNALGNDFVVIVGQEDIVLTKEEILFICNSKVGIGCDQLLLYQSNLLVIYNSNGTEAKACINGTRSLAYLMYLLYKEKKITIATKSQNIFCEVKESKGNQAIVAASLRDYQIFDFTYQGKNGYWVNIGNNHVIFIAESNDFFDLSLAQELNCLNNGQGVNVSFVHIISREEIKIRVYERGVGETNACGSAACASFLALYNKNLLQKTCSIYFGNQSLKAKILTYIGLSIEGVVNLTFVGSLLI